MIDECKGIAKRLMVGAVTNAGTMVETVLLALEKELPGDNEARGGDPRCKGMRCRQVAARPR